MLFEHGADLRRSEVLASIADPYGIDPADESDHAAVLADHAAGRERGVVGSPHFFVHGRGFFCPTLEIERVDGHLNISFDDEGFTAFIRTCFSEPARGLDRRRARVALPTPIGGADARTRPDRADQIRPADDDRASSARSRRGSPVR